MPDFYESGGAPAGKAILDYGYYGLLDPTNLLSVLAGAATLPAGVLVPLVSWVLKKLLNKAFSKC